jgi:acyl dehydratase
MTDILEQLRADIGTTRTSEWITIDQPMIDTFAKLTRDHQFIHVDPAEAARTPYGGTIAHGFLVLSMLGGFYKAIGWPELPGFQSGANYGFDKVRFLRPVPSGARIRANLTLQAVSEKRPGHYLETHDAQVDVEGCDTPAIVAEWLTYLIFDA